MAPECVQVKIEIGHKSICRTEKTKEGFTHDWVIFVRGAEGSNIAHFVDRVVFYLHESFPKPRRVIKDPPYRVAESGYGSFLLPVEIYFRNKDEPKKVRFEYDLYLQLVGNPPVNNVRVEALTFSDPVEEFKKKLFKAGGVVVTASGLNNPVSSPPGLPAVPPITKPEATNSTVAPPEPPGAVKKPKSSPSISGLTPQSSTSKPKPKDASTPQNSLGLKRPSTLDDNANTQKVKKKKIDKGDDSSSKPVVPKEISILSPQVNSVDKEKSKMKMTLPGLKKGKDNKERKKSVDGLATTPVSKPKVLNNGTVKESTLKESPPGKDSKTKELKPEKQKKEKTQKKALNDSPVSRTKEEPPKVQKLTVKRKSGDAWASSSSQVPPMGKNSKRDTKLDAIMAEFAKESSSDDDDDEHDVPFLRKEPEVPLNTLSNGNIHPEEHSSVPPPPEVKHITPKSKKGSKGKTIANLKSYSNNNNKVFITKKNDSVSPQNGKTKEKSLPLKDLYDRICSIEDSLVLQKVVDIVEGTGLFEVTDTTFDFDLCMLDPDTISKLEESVLIAV